jgi:two-component system alkaline phosphatase synthesis response regulator PhoP
LCKLCVNGTQGKNSLSSGRRNDILEIVSYNLLKEGYNVYTARDGNEALEKAKVVEPDLLILDILMPYKSGS